MFSLSRAARNSGVYNANYWSYYMFVVDMRRAGNNPLMFFRNIYVGMLGDISKSMYYSSKINR